MSWFNPPPFDEPIRYPRQMPKVKLRDKKGRFVRGGMPWNKGKHYHLKEPRKPRYHPDLSPSPELSYLLGALVGDGCICEVNYQITLGAIDKEFVEKTSSFLQKVMGRERPYPIFIRERKGSWRKLYIVNALSEEFYEYLKQGWSMHRDVIERCPEDFLMGLFDSEGGVYVNGRQKDVRLTNTNRELIFYTQELLKKLGISALIYEEIRNKYRTCYHLLIRRYEDIIKFAKRVGFTIKRKEEKLLVIVSEFQKRRSERQRFDQFVYNEYVLNHKSARKIAKEVGVDDETIRHHLIKLGVLGGEKDVEIMV